MREFKIFDLAMSIAALIIVALLIYLAIFMIGWIIGIEKMESLDEFMSYTSGVMISLLIIAGAAFALAFLVMFVCWLCKDEGGIMILPFEVAAGEEKYSGKAVSHLLTAELLRIRRIHKVKYKGISLISENFNFPVLAPSSENLTYSISQMGPVGLGTTSIHIGPLIAILKKLWPRGDNGQVISGSLQKYGSAISLLACLEHQKIRAWEASKIKEGDQVGDEIVPALARDLAFKMVQDLSQNEISAKTWQGFKHFTEALDAYHQYNLTDDMSYLERARIECLKAAKSEIGYEKLLKLLYNLGMAYSKKRELSKAEELLFLAYEIKPDDENALFGLGYLYGIQDRYQKSLDYFDRVTVTDTEGFAAWSNKGVSLFKLGRAEEAIEAYDKAIVINPQYSKAWLNKGVALYELGRMEEAIEASDKAIELNPQNAEAWTNKGGALINLGRNEEARKACEKAIDLDPRLAMAWTNKGGALANLGQAEEGLEACEKAIDLDPELAQPWSNKGAILGKLGRDREAVKAYEKAIEIDPQNVNAWYRKGLALSKLDRTDEALKAYENADELGLKSATLHIALARLYRKFGRESERAESCKLAHNLIERENDYTRACFEAVCGSADAALDLLRTALEKKQDTPEWARRDHDFESIQDDPRFKALLDEFSTDEGDGPE